MRLPTMAMGSVYRSLLRPRTRVSTCKYFHTASTLQASNAVQDMTNRSSMNDPVIHPTAVVHPDTTIGDGVRIGPYSVVSERTPNAYVVLADGVHLRSHVVIEGSTYIGSNTTIHSFASIGGDPQDKKHDPDTFSSLGDTHQYQKGATSKLSSFTLHIGADCVIREHATIHGCTSYSNGQPTYVGNGCWILCGAHIGHDAHVGDRVVLSNNACLAGHVTVGDDAVVGGQVGIQQHVHIGKRVMIGGHSAVDSDVIPYGLVMGNRAKLAGLNLVGLRRAKIPREEIKLLLRVYRYLFTPSMTSGTGFAPALALTSHTSTVERAKEVERYLKQHIHSVAGTSLAHELIEFVLKAPERYRTALCLPQQ